MRDFVRDPSDWLRKLTPDEWIRAALAELVRAKEALSLGSARGALAGCKRAAGMALNGALIVAPNPAWGRTYLEHLAALAYDSAAPIGVRDACAAIVHARAADAALLEHAYDVVAHAWWVVRRHEAREGAGRNESTERGEHDPG